MPEKSESHRQPPFLADPLAPFWLAVLPGAFCGGLMLGFWGGMMRAASGGALTINLPFANGFTQEIDPRTNWGWIGATDAPALEAEILRYGASYGRQIGRMMDLLLDIAEKTPGVDAAKLEALRVLSDRVEHIKQQHARL